MDLKDYKERKIKMKHFTAFALGFPPKNGSLAHLLTTALLGYCSDPRTGGPSPSAFANLAKYLLKTLIAPQNALVFG